VNDNAGLLPLADRQW